MASFHLVAKKDNVRHKVVTFEDAPSPLSELPPSSVRVRTVAITLSANNLAYARGGYRLNWWDTYPVPAGLAPPYNDREEWGIVPAWGRAEVLESNVDGLAPGDLLWGFQSTSSEVRLMQLEPMEPRGAAWLETSPQRGTLMKFYNTYRAEPRDKFPGIDPDAALGCRIALESPWLLYEYVFPADLEKRLHPLGSNAEWTAEDADLSGAVLISLSAAGKTARGFAWCVEQPRAQNKPLGLLQVTTNPKTLHPTSAGSPCPTHNVDYGAVMGDATFDWIKQFNPTRVVIFDFGARADLLQNVYDKVTQSLTLPCTVMGIGSEAKIYTADEQAAWTQTFQTVSKRQFNTGTVRLAAIAQEPNGDAAAYFTKHDETLRRLLAEQGLGDLKVDRRAGVQGVFDAWEDLCNGGASATEYINVYFT